MPQQIRAIVVDPVAPGKAGDQAGRVARSRPRRGRGQGHRDLAQPRRDAARGAGGRAGLAAGLGFRRRGRAEARDGSGPKAGTRVVGILPNGRLGRAGQLPQPCGRGAARRGQRRAGLDLAGRRPHRAARAAPGRAAARPQGAGRRRLGRGRASRLPACARPPGRWSGAMCGGEEQRAAVAEWCGDRVVLGRDLGAAQAARARIWLIVDSVGGSALSRGARHAGAERHLRDPRHLRRGRRRPSRAAISSAPAARGSTA